MSILQNNTLIKSTPSVSSAFERVLNDPKAGFTDIPNRTQMFSTALHSAEELKKKYDRFVVVGIGGSSMGPRTLVEMSFVKNIYFLDNVDSVEFARVWNEISNSLGKVGFIFISKSGTTIEVLWNYSLLNTKLKASGFNLIDQSLFISETEPNTLSNLAKEHKRPLLEIPVEVGGRFSVLTPVGLVIAGLCGYSLENMRVGAELALRDREGILKTVSHFLESFKRNESITLFWFYNSNYRWFGSWLQQLWAESLGKKNDRNGNPAPHFSSPFIAIGSCDQHSILQQVIHGTEKNKFVCFFNFESVEKSTDIIENSIFSELKQFNGRNYGDLIASQSLATETALKENGINTARFTVDDNDRSMALGFLFMYFQLIVATIGEHENVNAFDQPGVAVGKEIALKILKSGLRQ